MTREKGLSVRDAVAIYKELTEVESGFRQLKDVLAMRPIYHQIEMRVKAHIFVAALAFLVQRLLGRRLEEAGVDLSPARAMEALSTVRLVTFRLEGQPERRGMAGGCPDARQVLKVLKLVDQRPPTPPEGEGAVMEGLIENPTLAPQGVTSSHPKHGLRTIYTWGPRLQGGRRRSLRPISWKPLAKVEGIICARPPAWRTGPESRPVRAERSSID